MTDTKTRTRPAAVILTPAAEARVAELHEQGKAVNAAAALEIDAVIDPADSRAWIVAALDGWEDDRDAPEQRRFVDTW